VRAYYLHCCNRLFSLLSLITGVSAITVLLRISSFRDPEVPAGIRAFSTKKSPTTTVSYKSSPTIGIYLREIHEGAEAGICTVWAFTFGDIAFTAPNFQTTVRDRIFDLQYIHIYCTRFFIGSIHCVLLETPNPSQRGTYRNPYLPPTKSPKLQYSTSRDQQSIPPHLQWVIELADVGIRVVRDILGSCALLAHKIIKTTLILRVEHFNRDLPYIGGTR